MIEGPPIKITKGELEPEIDLQTEPVVHLYPSKERPQDYEQEGVLDLQDTPVFFSGKTLPEIISHLNSDPHNEQGGYLVGEAYADPHTDGLWVAAAGAIPLKQKGTLTQLDFTLDPAVLESKFPSMRLIGWYHSHPGHGIFLSDDDEHVHRFFQTANSLAFVYDPQSKESGLFISDNKGTISQLRGFYTQTKIEPETIQFPDLGEQRPLKITWQDYLKARAQKFIDREKREAQIDNERVERILSEIRKRLGW